MFYSIGTIEFKPDPTLLELIHKHTVSQYNVDTHAWVYDELITLT